MIPGCCSVLRSIGDRGGIGKGIVDFKLEGVWAFDAKSSGTLGKKTKGRREIKQGGTFDAEMAESRTVEAGQWRNQPSVYYVARSNEQIEHWINHTVDQSNKHLNAFHESIKQSTNDPTNQPNIDSANNQSTNDPCVHQAASCTFCLCRATPAACIRTPQEGLRSISTDFKDERIRGRDNLGAWVKEWQTLQHGLHGGLLIVRHFCRLAIHPLHCPHPTYGLRAAPILVAVGEYVQFFRASSSASW